MALPPTPAPLFLPRLEGDEIETESEKSDSSEDVKSLEAGCSVDLDQNGILNGTELLLLNVGMSRYWW